MKSPRMAARRFAETVLVTTLADVLDVAEHNQRAFQRVERAVRKQFLVEDRDVADLADAVYAAVPASHMEAFKTAFIAYDTALGHELTVREQTCYLIGLEIGRALR